jgi:putative hemolysin
MEIPPTLGLLAIALLVLANGFFVATEFAIVAVRRSRLEQLLAEGNTNARAAQHVVHHLDTYIAACQLGITIASLGLGWIGEPALAHLLEPLLERLVGQFAPAAAHGVSIGVAFAIITALHIVIGELAPKGLALQKPEATSLFVAQPMRLFELVFRWPINFLNGIGNGVLKLAGLEPATGREMVHSVAELRLLVTGSREAGVVEESEARIATRAFTFADLTAGALMTPRTEVDAIPVDTGVDQLMARLANSTHTRLPVYEGSLDNVVGILYTPHFYHTLHQASAETTFDLRTILRGHMIVPGSKPADDLLEEMRASGRYFAVVIDEYGGTAGILTLEDLIEALVGPLGEEVTAETQPTQQLMAQAPDGSMLLDGLTRLEEWEEIAGVHLDPADHDAVETVGGLIMAHLGRMPDIGDEIGAAGRTLRVEEMDGLRVARVRVLPSASRVLASTKSRGT